MPSVNDDYPLIIINGGNSYVSVNYDVFFTTPGPEPNPKTNNFLQTLMPLAILHTELFTVCSIYDLIQCN